MMLDRGLNRLYRYADAGHEAHRGLDVLHEALDAPFVGSEGIETSERFVSWERIETQEAQRGLGAHREPRCAFRGLGAFRELPKRIEAQQAQRGLGAHPEPRCAFRDLGAFRELPKRIEAR